MSMVYAGIPAVDVLKAATINGARALGIDDKLGSIETGKLVDLVVVRGNPLKDITLADAAQVRNGQVRYELKTLWRNGTADDPTNQLLGSSVAYRIAVGPQQGRKVFTLQTLPDIESDNLGINNVGEVAGFSLHAGVATKAIEREKLERLCRVLCAQLSELR